MGATRRARLDAPISSLLESFRVAGENESICSALAQIAMRLVDSDDRTPFQLADGATAMLDHLTRIREEQATLANAWQTSQLFGATWEAHEVHECLELTLVAICHASVDSGIANEMNTHRAPALLVDVLAALPTHLHAPRIYALECLRNLSVVGLDLSTLPKHFVVDVWRDLLETNEPTLQEVVADILCNLAFHAASSVHATQSHIAATLALLFAYDTATMTPLRIALADLLCNLCCDASYCLLVIYELDAHKPAAFKRHSGAVFFADLTEKTTDAALRQSMEALAHNVSWSDPAGKRAVQKLSLSRFLHRFAAEPAIR